MRIDEPTEWPPEPPPVTVNGKTYTYYQATQEQRRREREIRNLKRNLYGYEAAGMSELAQETKSLIRAKTTEYKKFSQAVNIRAKLDRLRVCEGNSIQIDAPYKALTGINFDDNMPVEIPKVVRKTIDSASKAVTRDFPMLDDYLYAVGYASDNEGNPATTHLSIDDMGNVGQMITLNPQMWSDIRVVNALVDSETTGGGHIQAKGAQAIITHEYGHVVHNTLALRKIGYLGNGNLIPWQKKMFGIVHGQIGEDVARLLKDEGLTILGARATDNNAELIAEAFSDYYSGRRSKASRRVISYLRKEMKK